MTAHIVDQFEIVDINDQHRAWSGVALHFLLDHVNGTTAVEHSRQAVAD
jgi:hypothetical protein